MAVEAHLSELVQKHRALEREIEVEFSKPSYDDLKIANLKKRKLFLKDEIYRLQHEPRTSH